MTGLPTWWKSDKPYIIGDCLTELRKLPDNVIHCCVTSPPYWGLRDYGVDAQIGLEESPEEYVAKLVSVFHEVKRILRSDGTCWLNLGDSYNAGREGGWAGGKSGISRPEVAPQRSGVNAPNLKPKDLVGIPWRVAFALQADGWYLRQDIIWSKPNPMPESVTDRCTKAHEYVFLLAKSQKYYYDNEAIKEPVAESTVGRGPVDFGGSKGRAYKENIKHDDPNFRGGNEQWGRTFDYTESCKGGRNKRSVWTVTTKPYSEAHFATYPPDLIEPMIKAGTSQKGCCSKCGAPWERIVESKTDGVPQCDEKSVGLSHHHSDKHTLRAETRENKTIGWQSTCSCNAEVVPCIVIDPFLGSGTTGEVARMNERLGIGFELNPKYEPLIIKRMMADIPRLETFL